MKEIISHCASFKVQMTLKYGDVEITFGSPPMVHQKKDPALAQMLLEEDMYGHTGEVPINLRRGRS